MQLHSWWPLAALLLSLFWGVASGENLSPRLRQWLNAHPDIRFAPERDYGPFVYETPTGAAQGLSVEFLQAISARVGIAPQTQAAQPLNEILAQLKLQRVDLVSSLRRTPPRVEYLEFTVPYVSVPAVLVTRDADRSVRGLNELAGKRVAIGSGYAVESFLRERFPRLELIAVTDDAAALAGLASGRVDAAVADSASVHFVRSAKAIPGLHVGPPVGFEYTLSFAVRKDWPELREILDIGITALGPQERIDLLARWIPEEARGNATRQPFWLVGVAAGLIFIGAGGLLWFRWRLRRSMGQSRLTRGRPVDY